MHSSMSQCKIEGFPRRRRILTHPAIKMSTLSSCAHAKFSDLSSALVVHSGFSPHTLALVRLLDYFFNNFLIENPECAAFIVACISYSIWALVENLCTTFTDLIVWCLTPRQAPTFQALSAQIEQVSGAIKNLQAQKKDLTSQLALAAVPTKSGWCEALDPSKKPYYFNVQTKETSWARPPCMNPEAGWFCLWATPT
jgi:hypothetical protein